MNEKLFNLSKQLKALADTGLVYQNSEYDRDRYEQIREISLEIMSMLTDNDIKKLESFYAPVEEYPTPKVDVRGFAVNKNNEILLVKEAVDEKWTIPGGWADIGLSASEVIKKEFKEETGLEAEVTKLLAVFDKKCHAHPPQPHYTYKIIFQCEVTGGEVDPDFDILEVGWFGIDNLPELSTDRILKSQIVHLYNLVSNKNTNASFD